MTNPVYRIIAVRTVQASLAAWGLHRVFGWPLTGRWALGLFLTPALCLYFVFVFVARWSWGLPILTRLPARERVVALTFDDGPSPETTPQVLAVLREFGVRATFFVLGEAVDQAPDLLRQIVAGGHTLGLHGHRHQPYVLLGRREVEAEIARARDAVHRACPGAALSGWLRPPHGFKTPALLRTARRAGYTLAAWSVDGRDYRGLTPERIAAAVLDRLHPGAVVLLHDGPENTQTAAALAPLLAGLKERGYECRPL